MACSWAFWKAECVVQGTGDQVGESAEEQNFFLGEIDRLGAFRRREHRVD